jgi:hypothetical protein
LQPLAVAVVAVVLVMMAVAGVLEALVETPHKLHYHQLLVVCQVIKAVPEHQVVVVPVTH